MWGKPGKVLQWDVESEGDTVTDEKEDPSKQVGGCSEHRTKEMQVQKE